MKNETKRQSKTYRNKDILRWYEAWQEVQTATTIHQWSGQVRLDISTQHTDVWMKQRTRSNSKEIESNSNMFWQARGDNNDDQVVCSSKISWTSWTNCDILQPVCASVQCAKNYWPTLIKLDLRTGWVFFLNQTQKKSNKERNDREKNLQMTATKFVRRTQKVMPLTKCCTNKRQCMCVLTCWCRRRDQTSSVSQ